MSSEYERRSLLTLLKSIPYDSISLRSIPGEPYIGDKSIPEALFSDYAPSNFKGYSYDEIKTCFNGNVKGKSVYELINVAAHDYLELNDSSLYYKDEKALGWRFVSSKLGDDIFAAAFLAKEKDSLNETTWQPFIFSKDRMEGPYAENHSHFNASVRTLELSWVALMNYPNEGYDIFGKSALRRSLAPKVVGSNQGKKVESLSDKCMKAAAYRAYLWATICNHSKLKADLYKLIVNQMEINTGMGYLTNELATKIDSLRCLSGCSAGFRNLEYIDCNYTEAECSFAPIYSYEEATKIPLVTTPDVHEDYRVLLGERALLLWCFYCINNNRFNDMQKNVFFRYLIIRNNFRDELIQDNGIVGLSNFKMFQDRKGLFYKSKDYMNYELPKMAIHNTISRNIKSLENRIIPGTDSTKMKAQIDMMIDNSGCDKRELRENGEKDVFFVMHVPKQAVVKNEDEYRHKQYREKLDEVKQAMKLLLEDPQYSYFVRGIDTCSAEIGCRPENFGVFYRELLDYRFEETLGSGIKNHFIKGTYHVGEDFLDIVDGLRAIDEVMLFCNFTDGCRLGHALALGIDPYEYYKLKNHTIACPKQDILDNYVWLYKRSHEFKISSSTYGAAYKVLKNKIIALLGELGYGESIEDYYASWSLRGDDPLEYDPTKPFIYKEPRVDGTYKLNDNPRINNLSRKKATVRNLVYKYYYDHKTYIVGSKPEFYEIDPCIIPLIKRMQDKMIEMLEANNIYIECNPSSNLQIGTINRYDEHPIVRFYSQDLDKKAKNALIASINTDDIGVFDTALENEYSIMKVALERAVKRNGSPKYLDVTTWIDNIRLNGLNQAFSYNKLTK